MLFLLMGLVHSNMDVLRSYQLLVFLIHFLVKQQYLIHLISSICLSGFPVHLSRTPPFAKNALNLLWKEITVAWMLSNMAKHREDFRGSFFSSLSCRRVSLLSEIFVTVLN